MGRVILDKEEYRELALSVFARQGFRCAGCGKCCPLQLHHQRGRGIGGGFRMDTIAETTGLCRDCHPHWDRNRTSKFTGELKNKGERK